jgi:TolA-binding protein
MQALKKAASQLKLVVVKYPKSNIAPETQYWYGITEFKITNNVSVEINAWRKIKNLYE